MGDHRLANKNNGHGGTFKGPQKNSGSNQQNNNVKFQHNDFRGPPPGPHRGPMIARLVLIIVLI